MNTPQNEFDEAQIILKKYYRELIKRMAAEMIEHREDFDSESFSGRAESIIDRYANQLHQLCPVFTNLNQFAFREKPKGKEILRQNDFRCFGCGGLIRQHDERCPSCGWSWK